MYIYIYILHMHMIIYIHTHTHTHIYIHTHTHTQTCIYIYFFFLKEGLRRDLYFWIYSFCSYIRIYMCLLPSWSTHALNIKTPLHKSNIQIEENRKLNILKHIYQCSKGKYKIMTIYTSSVYKLLQIKERNFIDKFKPKLNKTWNVNTHKRK